MQQAMKRLAEKYNNPILKTRDLFESMRRGGAKWLLASLLCSFHVQKELGRRERIKSTTYSYILEEEGW
jgi:hypothetical protein